MKQSGNDNYDLNTSSPQGHSGFEPFRTKKHYYFHFNDEAGDTILFSQAYKTKKGRDNGMVSIKKNIKNKAHLIFHHDDELHYFSIKARNNQEVARSRNFESKEEMETSIQYLYQKLEVNYNPKPQSENYQQIIIELKENLTEQKTIETELSEKIWELETALAETSNSLNEHLLQKEIWIKKKADLEEKVVHLAKRSSDLDASKTMFRDTKNSLEEIPATNFSFRINFYNIDNSEAVKMVIYHPMTKDKKILQGFDKEAMVEFMVSKLPSTTLPLITDNNEKPLDSTKNPETIVLAQNTPSHPITTVQNTANIPSIAEKQRLEASQKTQEATNFQMKAFLKAKKNSDMSTIKPTNTAEELAIINKFFRQEVKVPSTKITVEEKIGTTFKNMETTNINTVQIENSPEELAIINKFFRQEVKVPSTKIAAEEKIKTSFENLQISEVTNAEEEKIIQRFFPRVKENLRENLALADNSSNFLDAFITKNKAKKNRSIVAVLDTTNPQLEIDKAAEIAVVERFFPSVTKSKEQEEIAVQFDIDKVLNEVSMESEKRSAAEVEIINKFFKSEIKKEKVLLPKPLNLNLFPVEIVPQNNKKEQAIINKFFGGKFQNTIAKSRTVQGLSTHAKEEDIRLYNKFFGKNIPVKQSKKCCS